MKLGGLSIGVPNLYPGGLRDVDLEGVDVLAGPTNLV
jgi:hypothetical protein